MTLREKIADWISGGELSFQRNGWARSRAINLDIKERSQDGVIKINKLRRSLILVSMQETPNANATVRRMSKIARDALAELAGSEVDEFREYSKIAQSLCNADLHRTVTGILKE